MDVIEIIKQTLKIPEEQITDDLGFQSISEWNSMNHVSLILALEEASGVTINDELMLELTSVAEIKKFASGLMQDKGPENLIETDDSEDIDSENCKQSAPIVFRGLNNITFDNTTITNMDGNKGILEYRGYSIHDLVEHSTYEEVAYLLLYKELPTREQLECFGAELKSNRNVPSAVEELVVSMADADPTLVLRTATSMLAHYDTNKQDNTAEGTRIKAIRLIAQLPVITAIQYRTRNGLPVIQPSATLGHAANILYMLQGKEPTRKQESIVDKILILHTEHGSNASTFTTRVVIGTEADIYGAITSAIAAFSGPLHGGAIQQTMKMLREIEDPSQAESYIQARRERNEAVMGFGHRVYRTEDPRARHLRQGAVELCQDIQETKWLDILDAVVEAMRPYSKHGVHVNVDYYACVIYHLLGLMDDIFVPMFIFGRIAGWSAHVLEQMENNILIRPLMNYVGQKSRIYISDKEKMMICK